MAKRRNVQSMVSGGKRPDFKAMRRDSSAFEHDFQSAMHYVQYEIKYASLKTNAVNYAKKQELDHKSLDLVVGHKFSTLGKACYILVHGGEIPKQWEVFVETEIAVLIEEGKAISSATKVERKTTPTKVRPSIQDTLRDQAAAMVGDFDSWIDEFASNPKKFDITKCDPLTILKSKGARAAHARYIIGFYEKDEAELVLTMKKEDPQLVEAYSGFTAPQMKRFVTLYETIISAANMIIEASKATRLPRKRKKIDIEKAVSNLKYQKEDSALRVVSINPVEIIGAKELWVYNTKTRKLGRYIAEDGSELDIRGTSVRFYSPESVEKTLRKPKEQIAGFRKAGKVALRKFMGKLTTVDIKLKGRLSENHILLKVL